jgi:hypothetical protein
MISALVGAILTLLVAGICFWALQQLIAFVPLPEPFARVVYVLMILLIALIVIYVIVSLLAPLAGVHVPSWVR